MRIIFAASAQPGCKALKVHIAAGKENTVIWTIIAGCETTSILASILAYLFAGAKDIMT